ncbi:MAG: hypothetical protein KatS3mg009_2514 [Acidimicrobiia bacterium]|nr:MAG: hypothetical protein KatS3mg009_2514 [Acidimicrobiia bacterium]
MTAPADATPRPARAVTRAGRPTEGGRDRTAGDLDDGDAVAWTVTGVVAGALTGLWLTRGAWGPGLVAGGDVTAHLVRADFGIAEIVARGRLDGWSPRFMLGHQLFLFNGPGVTWAIALLRAATFGVASNPGALKALVIATFALQPAAVAYLARSLGLDRRASALAGILSLTVSVGFGLGMEGTFVNGLVSHQLGALVFFVALGALLRLVREPRSWRRRAVAGVAVAALAVTHVISTVLLALVAPIAVVLVLTRDDLARGREIAAGLAAAGAVAVGLGAFWLFPFAAGQELRGPVVTWGTDPFERRVAALLRGDLVWTPAVAKLVMTGWVAAAACSVARRRRYAPLLALPLLVLVAAHVAIEYPGPGDLTIQLANRALGYVGVLALVPVAAVAGDLLGTAGRRLAGRGAGTALALAAVACAVAFVARNGHEELAGELGPPAPEMREAAERVASLVPEGARFAVTRDYPAEIARTGVIEPARWLAWASGRDVLNGFNPEASVAGSAAFAADGPREGETADEWLRELRRLGVSHVVVTRPDVREALRSASLASPVWARGELSIHEVTADDGGPAPPGAQTDVPAEVTFAGDAPERPAWTVDAAAPATLTLALQWSPKWHASVDGAPAAIARTPDALMAVRVPAGEHTVRLAYRPDAVDRAGAAVTAATLLALGAVWQRRRLAPVWARAAAAARAARAGGAGPAGGGHGRPLSGTARAPRLE